MLIICASAGGSPGVTTTTLGLALTWPRDVLLADCDPHPNQAVLAGYLRGISSGGRGLGTLTENYRAGTAHALDALLEQTIALDASASISRRFLPGFTHPRQAPLFVGYWDQLGAQLDDLQAAGTDVILDAGRLDAAGLATGLIERARLILLVTRSNLPALAMLKLALPDLVQAISPGSAKLALLVAGAGRPYSASEIATQLGLPLLAELPWDPATAGVLSDGDLPGRKLTEQPLWRAFRSLSMQLNGQTGTRRLQPSGRHRTGPGGGDEYA